MQRIDRAGLLEDARFERELHIRRARQGKLLSFTTLTKPDYYVGWHHLLTAKVLNMFLQRQIKRLIITEPPRHGKSELSSRRAPALIHGLYPDDEIMLCSYNADIAGDMTVDVQRIMDTDNYREIFPLSRITPEGSNSSRARRKNEHELIPVFDETTGAELIRPQGSMRSAGIGGSFTGRGADWIFVDDPFKNREEADSAVTREAVWKFWTSTLRTRLEGEGSVLITMTRWHSDDLVGRLLAQANADPEADQWMILHLPAIKDREHAPYDNREIGQALWPEKFSEAQLRKIRASIGDRDWSALYQGEPVVEGGNIIKADWIKYYDVLPEHFDELIQSWDFAVKAKQTSDFTVGQIWGRKGADFYLVHQVRGRFPFPIACQKVIDMSLEHPKALKKLFEAKANGPAVKQTLEHQVPGITDVEPTTDKVARLNAVAPLYQAGNVHYPNPKLCPWITQHVNELCTFPLAAHDDTVDTASQALNEMRKAGPVFAPISGHSSAQGSRRR